MREGPEYVSFLLKKKKNATALLRGGFVIPIALHLANVISGMLTEIQLK